MFIGHFGVAFAAKRVAPRASLGTTILATGLLDAIWPVLVRRGARTALVLGAIVLSHWVLDWVVHKPDLPLYPGDAGLHGLGLWNSMPATLALEFAFFAGGLYLYMAATRPRDRTGTVALWALVATLLACYFAATFGPAPPSPEAVAYSALIGYVMVAWGWWIDRHRENRVP